MELVGVFDLVADKEDEANMYDDSSLWDFTGYAFCSNDATTAMAAEYFRRGGIEDAFFYVTDAAKLNNIIADVQKISSINWNNYTITANDVVYQNISSALSDTGTLITTLIIVITAVSMVLIILILSMSIRSRKRETGILLAVGIAKPAVILQYVLETLLIAVVAFPLAYLSSKQVAGTWVRCSARRRRMLSSRRSHFLLVAVVGGILLVAAVLVSSISIMRLKPNRFWHRWSKGGCNMNLGIRAILYSARKWKRRCWCSSCSWLLPPWCCPGWRLPDAQEEQSEELRGVTGASFTVNATTAIPCSLSQTK